MNKKGFTVVEVVIAFSMLAVILATLIGFTVNYRSRVKSEEVKTQLLDYKNTITKVIYDDIILGGVRKIEKCDGEIDSNIMCVNFINEDESIYPLRIVEDDMGIYLNYNGNSYLLPDSDLNKTSEKMCYFTSGFNIRNYDNIYNLQISYKHVIIDESYDIMVTIN